MTQSEFKVNKAQFPPGLGLKEPFARWDEPPDVCPSMLRFVDHSWLRIPHKVVQYVRQELPMPDVAWYFQMSVDENVDLKEITGRVYKAWTANQEKMVFLRYNYFRYRLSLAARRSRNHDKRKNGPYYREMKDWEQQALNIRSVIAAQNLGLVLSMCSKRAKHYGLYDSEMVSEGNMALLRAIDLFNCGYNFKFSTYACRAVLKSLSRYQSKRNKINQFEGMSYSPEDQVFIHPTYEDPDLGHDEFSYRMERMKKVIRENTANLSEIELLVLVRRFNFDDPEGPKKSLLTIGEELGVTKERIRQIQNTALKKLHDAIEEG